MGEYSPIDRSYFDTRPLSAPDRFSAWRDTIDVVVSVDPHDEAGRDRYGAQVRSILLDDIAVNHCRLGAQTFCRDALRVAADGIDYYQVHIFLDGEVEMDCGGRRSRARRNEFAVLDNAAPYRSWTTDYEKLNMFVPRRRLAPLLDRPDSHHGVVFDGDSGAGAVLRDYLSSLMQASGELTTAQAPKAAEALVQLSAMAMNGATFGDGDPPAEADTALLLRAQNFIKDNLADPALGPDRLAGALGLSRSRLYSLFQPCGGVAAYVREMRLRRAFTDLASPRNTHVLVSQIAYGWGFGDPAHFTRLFTRRFGASPSDVRAAGADASARRAANADDLPVGDTKYAYWIATLA